MGCSCGVHRCHSPGKHPISKNWKTSFVTSASSAIKAFANKNIGVLTGNGLMVVDVDHKNDGGISLAELEKEHGKLPSTLTVETGNGFHYYYRTEERVPNSVGLVGDGIDIRGENAFVVAPPSVHQNRKQYKFASSSPEDIAAAPKWLVEAARAKRTRKSGKKLKIVQEGRRNTHLTSLGGMLRKNGLTEKAIFEALMTSNRENCSPPLPEEEVRKISSSVSRYDAEVEANWRASLVLNGSGAIVKSESNVFTIMTESDVFKNCLIYDNFTGEGTWDNQPNSRFLTSALGPKVKLGTDFVEVQRIMAKEYGVNFTKPQTIDGMNAAMKSKNYDSLVDHVKSFPLIKSKKVGDLENWLIYYLGARNCEYHRILGKKFLISMVARALNPGCKVDYMMVLESEEQGIGKSTVCQILGGPFYMGGPLDIKNKDFLMKLRKTWVYEIGELAGFRKSQLEQMKHFITETVDVYRAPYERSNVRVPRRCVFIGTTNETNYLTDDQNRRFWPVKLAKKVKLLKLEEDREYLLSQAREAFKAGEKWWPSVKEQLNIFRPEQDKRRAALDDPWYDEIKYHLDNYVFKDPDRKFVPVRKILKWIGVPTDKQTPHMGKRAAKVMAQLGYKRVRAFGERGYEAIESQRKRAEELSEMPEEVESTVPGDAFPEG